MRNILHMIRKEFIQIRRDRRMYPLLFISPIIQLLLFGYAANLDVRDVPVVVCDLDNSQTSREFLARFENSGYFRFSGRVGRLNDVDPWLDGGKASLAILLPRNFGTDLEAGKTVEVGLIVDGAESQSAIVGFNYATMVVSGYSRDLLLRSFSRMRGGWFSLGVIKSEARVWYNPELKSRKFFIPGVLAQLVMLMTMTMTSLGIVKEKEGGTMEQLGVTPIRPYQLILGKFLPFLIIGLVDIGLVLTVATFWFRIPVKGSVLLVFVLGLVFMMTTLGLGLFISTVSQSQQQAMMTSIFFILPQIILSGFVFPIENMPKIIQVVSYLVPLRYFLIIIRGLFLKGVGMKSLWGETASLLAFGIIILTLSVLMFRKKAA